MKREWKPGDVANILSAGTQLAFRTTEGWVFIDGSTAPIDADNYAPRSPLVVIDPEDREQVERLSSLIEANGGPYFGEMRTAALQAALREFDNPTLSEPTDPKARVTDSRENIWRLLADGDWVCVDGPDIGEYIVWWQLAKRGPLEVSS